MNSENGMDVSLQQSTLLERFQQDIRSEYEPSLEYHGWSTHILTGLERISDLEAFCIDHNLSVDWFVVRAAYLGHDAALTRTMLDPQLLEDYTCAEQLSAEITHHTLKSYGLDEELLAQIDYCIMATNPNYPCDTLEAKVICRVDIGNTGDDFDTFFLNFLRIQLERNSIDTLLLNPLGVIKGACDFIGLYLRRSELSLNQEDNFPSRVEQNLNQLRSMGAQAVRSALLVHRNLVKRQID